MDYSEICYKRSCLSQVIVRIDFFEFIETRILFSNNVEKVLLPYYPKKGMQQLIKFQTMSIIADFNGAKTEGNTVEGVQQEFSNSEGNKIILSNKFLILEINKYTDYETILSVFFNVLRVILSEVQLTSIRTGIRYINIFDENGIKPQKNYFTPPISSLVESKISENNSCIRSLTLSEYVVDDMHLNFRYGMYNPQYPQPIQKPHFVLDYDCYCDEQLKGYESIVAHVDKGHNAIQVLFENSISKQLKKVMENG